jgi:hypothetical protein
MVRIVHERFFVALEFLKQNRHAFTNVLITDCRDVVIQEDPFKFVQDQLMTGLEPEIIRNESYTSAWIEAAYGHDFLESVNNQSVICAGVTIGPTEKVENYLTTLCDEMWAHLPQMVFKDFGYDQAAHIYLIYSHQLEVNLISNQEGIISTISLEKPENFSIDVVNQRVKIHHQYPAIIHQYDRHPALLNLFRKAFA